MMWNNLVFALVFGAVLMLFTALNMRRPRRDLGAVIRPALGGEGEEEQAVVEQRKSRMGLLSRLEQEAKKAGVKLTARDFIAVAVITGAGGFVAGVLVAGAQAGALLSLGGLAAPYVLLARAKRQRATVLTAQLEPVLMSIAASLRAGASLAQGIERAASSAPFPIGDVIKQVDRAVKLGATPAEAVEEAARTVDSREWQIWAASTSILTRAGGNLADVYDRLVETVRDRKGFRAQLRALTAQPRMSALLVSLLPVGTVILVRLTNPAYFQPMLATWSGRALLIVSVAAIAVGWLIIQKMLGSVPEEG